ncbi:Sec1p, partial [Ascoidea rubescens DSM 1968]
MVTNLIHLQRNYILNLINSVQSNLKYLILDDKTQFLIYSILDKQTLLKNVTAISNISEKRDVRREFDGIYILDSNLYSINCLLIDLNLSLPSNNPNNIDQTYKSTRYKTSNIFLLPVNNNIHPKLASELNAKINNDIRNNQMIKSLNIMTNHNALNSINNINNCSLQIFYNKNYLALVNYQIIQIVQSLINLCILTDEYPIIKYYNPKNSITKSSILSKKIAELFQSSLDDYARNNTKFPSQQNQRQRSIFLICDRTLDVITNLISSFTYQSMIYDTFTVTNDSNYFDNNEVNSNLISNQNIDVDIYNQIVKYLVVNVNHTREFKYAKLNEEDPILNEVRHEHVLKAGEIINNKNQEMKAHSGSNDADGGDRHGNGGYNSSIDQVRNQLVHMDEFDNQRRLIYLHNELFDKVLKTMNNLKLNKIADFENTLAANGYDIDNEKFDDLSDNFILELSQSDYSKFDKIKLILIYSIYRNGIILKDFEKLFKFINLNNQEVDEFLRLVRNFENLNIKIIKEDLNSHHYHHNNDNNNDNGSGINFNPNEKKSQYYLIDNTGYSSSRFKPAVENIVNCLLNNNEALSKEFSFVKQLEMSAMNNDFGNLNLNVNNSTTSLRNKNLRPKWKSSTSMGSSFQLPKQRIFVYVAGGINYEEISSMYKMGKILDKDIILGSENLINSKIFMNNV